MMHTVYLSLGSNLGNRQDNLTAAINEIGKRIGHVKAQSAFLDTQPWGFESSHIFLNAAVCVETELSPFDLLRHTQQIERDLGRTEKTRNGHYNDRIIDIDILLYDDIHISTPTLTIPHPLMQERDFVLIPLTEILPKKE